MSTEPRTGWRAIPPILLVAFAIELAFAAAHTIERTTISMEGYFEHVDRWQMASTGVWALFSVMVCIGLFDLAARRSGREAVAARLAGIMYMAMFALGIGLNALSALDLLPHEPWIWKVDRYAFWAMSVVAATGLAIAAPRRARTLAIGGFAVAMLGHLPPFVGELIFAPLELGFKGAQVLYTLLGMMHTAGTLILVLAAADGASPSRHDLAVKGFDRTAGALWLRLVGAAIGMVFGLIAATSAAQGSFTIMKLTMMAALVVNLSSFAVFGLGALDVARSELDGVARFVAAIAGAASLWCAGVMVEQAPRYYQILYGHDSGSRSEDFLQALSVTLPVVGTISCVAFSIVIAGFARARNDQALAARASSAGTSYALLMIASIGITSYLLANARSASSAIGMMIVAAGCGLVALMILSKVCRAASFALEAAPGLPQAVAKISDPT